MNTYRTHSVARRAIALGIAGALSVSPIIYPVAAYADQADNLQQQLDIAQESLYALQENLSQAEAELGKANYDLDATRAEIDSLTKQIAENKELLAHKQEGLSAQVASSYKHGTSTMLEVVLGSTDFDDFVSRLFYVQRINDQYATAISEVNDLRAELETEEADLKQHETDLVDLVAQQEEKVEAMNAASAQQQQYINQLSDELKAALEERRRREAEAARAAAEAAAAEEAKRLAAEQAAAAAAAQKQSQSQSQQQSQNQGQTTTSTSTESTQTTTEETTTTSDYEEESYEDTSYYVAPSTPVASYTAPSTASVDQRTTAVNAALSQVGGAYIWGELIPGVGMDCNGLTYYAWQQAGVDIPYTSGHYSYGQFQWLKASGRWVYSASELQLGDLVFYSNDGGNTCFHVALYVGNGMVVHAIDYARGIQVTEYDWCHGFCGGGSPI